MARTHDLLLVLTGPPYSSDLVTTALRLCQAVLDRDGSVQVWACGYATMLTQRWLGDTKPRNLRDWRRDHPSSLGLVRAMLADHEGRMAWIGCTACSNDRGALHHVPEVTLRSPTAFAETIAGSAKTIFIGGA